MNYVQPIRDIKKIEEIKAFLKKKSLKYEFLFFLGINTGLRISDLLPLKVKDIRNKTHITLIEEKTNKYKKFPLYNLDQEIKDYIEGMDDDDYLFPSRTGKGSAPIKRIQAYRVLNEAGKHVGLGEIGTHTLRKTFGYHFYQRKKDVAMLQKLFNHSAPSVTLRYIGIDQDMIDAEMMDFKI